MARGFTLIELMIALAVIAALLAIFIPGTAHQAGHAELASTVRTIGSALRTTRMHAIAANEPDVFVVDVQNARYRAGARARAQALPTGIHVLLYTTQDETLSAMAGAIRFFPDGSSSGGGLTIGNGHDRYDVRVDWLTGGISIHEQSLATR
jgi:general secretion pathway protein H